VEYTGVYWKLLDSGAEGTIINWAAPDNLECTVTNVKVEQSSKLSPYTRVFWSLYDVKYKSTAIFYCHFAKNDRDLCAKTQKFVRSEYDKLFHFQVATDNYIFNEPYLYYSFDGAIKATAVDGQKTLPKVTQTTKLSSWDPFFIDDGGYLRWAFYFRWPSLEFSRSNVYPDGVLLNDTKDVPMYYMNSPQGIATIPDSAEPCLHRRVFILWNPSGKPFTITSMSTYYGYSTITHDLEFNCPFANGCSIYSGLVVFDQPK